MFEVQSTTKAAERVISSLKDFSGDHKVIVGLSGGVDSSLAAALFVKAGWDVEGVTLWLMSGKGACCSDGLVDAAAICNELGISHNILDSRENFKKEIVENLINGYQQGITPLPCSRCNRSVKFSQMLDWAKENRKFDYVATGHYARVLHKDASSKSSLMNDRSPTRHKLLRGIDAKKDQSYFLYDLSQDVLGSVLFPLGEITKEDTRKEALGYGLRTAKKAESQDLCLVETHGSMKAFLDSYIPPRKGEIVLKDGTLLGKHDGIEHFTIGQRKGLGVSWKEPLHVIRLDSEFNRVVVASRNEAGKSNCFVSEINWISIDPPIEKIHVEVQVRYRSSPVPATLVPIKPNKIDKSNDISNKCELIFENEQFSITPGQAAVFYSGEVVLGGGLIEKFYD